MKSICYKVLESASRRRLLLSHLILAQESLTIRGDLTDPIMAAVRLTFGADSESAEE